MKSQIPEFEYIENEPPRRTSSPIWDVMTIMLLIGMCSLGMWFIFLFFNPSSAINPYPPPTLPVALVLPTSTNTPFILPPTWTPTVTATVLTPTSTITNTPVSNLPPTYTPTVNTRATNTPNASTYPFALQTAPSAVASTLFRPESGCNWTGIAGQIFDQKNGPMIGIQVRLGGGVNGKLYNQVTLSGLAHAYGDSGFEIKLGDTPFNSTSNLYIQLFDQSDIPISPQVRFDTFTDCSRNLVIINFKQVR
jgi:hypothetical protein